MLGNYLPHFALLSFDRASRINYSQTILIYHAIIFLENPALKDSETFLWIIRPTHIQTGFVIFETRSSGNNPVYCDVEGRTKEKRNRRPHCKRVDFANPVTIAASRDVASKCSVDIAIGKNDCSCFEWRNNVSLGAIGKICR